MRQDTHYQLRDLQTTAYLAHDSGGVKVPGLCRLMRVSTWYWNTAEGNRERAGTTFFFFNLFFNRGLTSTVMNNLSPLRVPPVSIATRAI